MSNDVVISKELRDKIINFLKGDRDGWAEELSEIRAAPETVSLEEVERMKLYQWLNSQENGETELARFSDLRRLVAPIQPSAVVTREAFEAIKKWAMTVTAGYPWDLCKLIDNALAQLPKLQTVGRVDLSLVIDALKPVASIICPVPSSATRPDSFDRGSPLTPAQIRKMQEALAHLQAPDESPKQTGGER